MTEQVNEVDLFPNSTEYPRFSELQLAKGGDAQITFSREAMERFCRAFGKSLDTLSEDDLGALITALYLWHRAVVGGGPHPVVESLLPQASTTSNTRLSFRAAAGAKP